MVLQASTLAETNQEQTKLLDLLEVFRNYTETGRTTREEVVRTEHQLFEVTERSTSIDFSSKYLSNAFLDLFSNVLFSLQALWQARWYLFVFQLSREPKSLQNGPCATQIFTFGRRYNHYRD
jgi:hypothetical protein